MHHSQHLTIGRSIASPANLTAARISQESCLAAPLAECDGVGECSGQIANYRALRLVEMSCVAPAPRMLAENHAPS